MAPAGLMRGPARKWLMLVALRDSGTSASPLGVSGFGLYAP